MMTISNLETAKPKQQQSMDAYRKRLRDMAVEDVGAEMMGHTFQRDRNIEWMAAPDISDETRELLQYQTLELNWQIAACDAEITRKRNKGLLPYGLARTAITPEFIQDVKANVDLADFVERSGVSLKKRGKSLVGLCPFHNDRKSPNFHVYLDEDPHFHCFGCQKHGDAFDFVMLHEKIDFIGALKLLAERAGMEVPRIYQNGKSNGNGHKPNYNPDAAAKDTPKPPSRRKLRKTAEYAEILRDLGYAFAYNLCTHAIEVNGAEVDDNKDAEIRTKLRDAGIIEVNVVSDVIRLVAARNSYHPVRDYLNSLEWNDQDVIRAVSQHFICNAGKGDMFEKFFRRWCIGTVARVMQNDAQNRVLLLAGEQGMGKDTFARWLCSPLPTYFNDSPVRSDDKDHALRLLSVWIWNISEVGSTMRKQDREALKHRITIQQVRERKPYGRHDIVGSAMTSFIGSFNDDGTGILNDPTGTRRFAIVPLLKIDWGYKDCDINQMWAQAVALYRAGEKWDFDNDERSLANDVNDEFQSPDIVKEVVNKFFDVNPLDTNTWTPTVDIIDALKNPLVGNLKIADGQLTKDISRVLKQMGLEKPKPKRDGGSQLRGYVGIKRRM